MLNPKHKLYRWGPISACPLFMYFAIKPAFAPLKKLFGITYTESVIIFDDGKVTWLLDDKELGKESKEFVDAVILNPQKNKQYYSLWEQRTKQLLSLFDRLDKQRLHDLSDKQLITVYKQFSVSYFDWFIITISLELAASSLEPLLGVRLKKYFAHKHEKEYNNAFSTLTAPRTLTFYRREQEDLLNILLLPQKEQRKALEIHQKQFYWIYNSYAEGKIIDIGYFQDELNKLKQSNYRKTLAEIQKYPAHILSEKKKIIRYVCPDNKDLQIIHQVETLSRLLDDRKKNNFKAEHYLELFVREFARRTHKTVANLKLLFPEELSDAMKHTMDLSQRKQCFVLVCTDKKIEEFNGHNAKIIADQFLNVTHINESMIHGQVASTGEQNYFRGVAKIVLTIKEIHKIHEGDILVTTMTSPDFVIGMKKAGAIITDTGGMLSHAAIVAREFKKPCIVGTEIATRVIHDGDIVELHCGKGTVKIIKQKK